jgi:hypothetical protein
MKLHTVKYNYKQDNPLGLPSQEEHTGFIAQEVREVIPEAVSTGKDGYLVLHVDPIHWAMVNAVKELKEEKDAEIDRLKAENQEIKSENQEIKATLEMMKQALCARDQQAGLCQ